MGKYENMTKHERVQKAADILSEMVTEANTGFPKPIGLEAVVRQIAIGMAKANLMIEISQVEKPIMISLDRAKKYAEHQHYLGSQGLPFVDFEDWSLKG
jgi:hypothetical protein